MKLYLLAWILLTTPFTLFANQEAKKNESISTQTTESKTQTKKEVIESTKDVDDEECGDNEELCIYDIDEDEDEDIDEDETSSTQNNKDSNK